MFQTKFSYDEGIIFRLLGDILCDQVWFSCLIFLIELLSNLSNLFHHLLISVCMLVAIFVARKRLWKPTLKSELKQSDFNFKLTPVSMEIFCNFLSYPIFFIDSQSIKLVNYFILFIYFVGFKMLCVRNDMFNLVLFHFSLAEL